MFGYFKAYALAKLGKDAAVVKDALSAAGSMTTDYCFPSRLEELEVLQWAANGERSYRTKEERANTHYYYGSILWNMDQKTPALASWKIAVKLNPKHALALRCVGFAVSHPGTYFTNTGVPSGIPSREAYGWYVKSLEAEPHFRTLDEAGKLAERLELPPAERLALMEKYMTTVNKYDPCILRLAYTYNAVGRYADAYKILTTRRFHVWEGADGLLAPFIEACHGLGKAAMEKKDYKTALKYFKESTTYPENLQAGRPGDAGIEPKSRYFMAQCKKALGDEAGCRAELENSLKGWIHAGEMDYWRVKALRELGRDSETAPLIAELKQAIKELETPPPTVINAYAKFAGDNSAMERAAKARFKAGELKRLLKEIEFE
jgi:tetratricopeptide (TPR) repeat protein